MVSTAVVVQVVAAELADSCLMAALVIEDVAEVQRCSTISINSRSSMFSNRMAQCPVWATCTSSGLAVVKDTELGCRTPWDNVVVASASSTMAPRVACVADVAKEVHPQPWATWPSPAKV